MIIGALVGAASSAGGILKGVTGLIGGIGKGRDMNPERLENAQNLAAAALEGGPLALIAARALLGGSLGMHDRSTAEGNGYFRDGWQLVQQYRPALAAEAQRLGGTKSPPEFPVPKQPAATEARLTRIVQQLQGQVSGALAQTAAVVASNPVQDQLGGLWNDIRTRTADTVLNLGAGATTAAAGAIGGDGQTRVAVPVSRSGMPSWLPWALVGVVGLIVVVPMLRR